MASANAIAPRRPESNKLNLSINNNLSKNKETLHSKLYKDSEARYYETLENPETMGVFFFLNKVSILKMKTVFYKATR